jgi:hypothetical protein
MRRDTLGLADNSLFIENINHACMAAHARLQTKAPGFFKESVFGFDSTHYQAANLHLDHHADVVTIAGALLVPLIWQDVADPGEVLKHFCRIITAALKDLSTPFILRIDSLNFIYAT